MIVNSVNDLAPRQIPRTYDFVKDLRAYRTGVATLRHACTTCFLHLVMEFR